MEVKGLVWSGNHTSTSSAIVNLYRKFWVLRLFIRNQDFSP
jgi:hypothetical protein